MYTLLSLLHAYSYACLYNVCLIAWLIIYLTACLHIWVNILLHASLHVSSSVFLVLKYFISVQNNLQEIMNYIIVHHVFYKFMSRFSFQVNYAFLNVSDNLNTLKGVFTLAQFCGQFHTKFAPLVMKKNIFLNKNVLV